MIETLVSLLGRLPLRLLHLLGAAGGWIAFIASSRYRRRLRENLRQAGLVSESVLEHAIAAAGKQALESAWVWTRPGADLLRACEAADPAEEAAILAEGRPVVFLTPHLGCFEIIAQYYMLRPVGRARPMTALYRVPHKPALRPLLEAARAHHGLRLAPAELGGVRKLIRALKNNEVVGILPDQVPSQGDGVWAPFFGRPAYTMTLPARLAVAQRAIVAFIYAERLPRGRGFRLHWERVAEPLTGEPLHDATVLNQQMERLIRRLPAQYLWGYNRYKVPRGAPPAPAAADASMTAPAAAETNAR